MAWGQEPQITQKDPKAYYLFLVSQGMPRMQAVQLVEQRFGPPQSPEDRAKAAQGSALGQVAGTVGGLIAGRYVYNQAGKLIDKFTGAPAPEEVVKQVIPSATAPFVPTPATPVTTPPASTMEGMFTATPQNNLYTPVQDPSVPQGFSRVNVQSGANGTTTSAVIKTEMLQDKGFLDSINWGKAAQGAGGALQLVQAYNMYKSGNKGGAALVGSTGAANLAASGAMGASAAGTASGAMGGYLVPGLNIAAGLYGGYQTAQMLSDAAAGTQRTQQGALGGAASGAAIGTAILPGIGTAIGAAVGAIAGAAGSWAGSSKNKAQVMRDGIRNVLQQNNILDKDFQGTLADGSMYDFGKDGSTLKWKEIDKVAAANPNAWSPAVNLADALSVGYGFVGQKASDIAAWYAKAAVSNAGDDAEKAKSNMRHFAAQQGLTFEGIKQQLDSAKADNRVSEDQYNRYLAGAQDLFTGLATPGVTTPGSRQITIARPKKGEVARLSPGMYRSDSGKLVKAPTMRDALEKAYNKTRESKEL